MCIGQTKELENLDLRALLPHHYYSHKGICTPLKNKTWREADRNTIEKLHYVVEHVQEKLSRLFSSGPFDTMGSQKGKLSSLLPPGPAKKSSEPKYEFSW
jgi:hypothetical protein